MNSAPGKVGMRVAFTHGDASWPTHSAFEAFRQRLARELGLDLMQFEGFGGERSWSEATDELVPLLSLAEPTGTIPFTDAPSVARRLRELVGPWPSEDEDRVRALLLAEGLFLARLHRQPFGFDPDEP